MDVRVAFVVAAWFLGWWLLWRVPRLARTPLPVGAAPADCTVVIPARDEEASIEFLLASLARQAVRPAQILVVDDQSSDGTAEIARSFAGVTVVTGEPLPAGWTGKAWACHQGARLATSSVLVFLDADVALEPDALASLLAEHRSRGGLVSVQPFHHMERAYEQLSALFNVIGFMGVGAGSPRRGGRSRGAFGPCLVTARDDYEEVGGHESVRGEIVEDIALARRYEAHGRSVVTLGGDGAVSFRMYPCGIGQLIEGWSKNIATGAGSIGLLRTAAIGVWVTGLLLAVQFAIELARGTAPMGWAAVAAVYAAFSVQLIRMLHQLGTFTWLTAVAFPVALGFFVVVFARSVYLTVFRRRVTWRGRPIPLRRTRRWSVAPAARPE